MKVRSDDSRSARHGGRAARSALRSFAVPLAAALLGLSLGPGPETARGAQVVESVFLRLPYAKVAGGKEVRQIKALTPSGLRARFLVVKKRNVSGETWFGIRLPKRPNRALAWVRAEKVNLRRSPARLVLSLKSRRLALFLDGRRVWRTSVVVGRSRTPTPRGLFGLWDRRRVRGDTRPWIFETTAHSRRLRSFNGAPARIAFHGRHGKLDAPWGSASSNGCIRTPNWALRSIRKQAALGTPVEIR